MSALSDLRVIDLSTDVAGPFCAKLFADFGADVIKVEPPQTGDEARLFPPIANEGNPAESSGMFLYLNTNKRGVTLNLEPQQGLFLLRQLLSTADIVVENFPPGAMDTMGLRFDSLQKAKPGIVLVSLTLLALTDGPETSTDAEATQDYGITHSSTVYYDKDTDPFVAYVDRVYWGARPAENLNWNESGSQWQREPTLYKEWDGDSWETVVSVNAGPWRSCGSSANGLCWWNLNNDVTLEGSARVDQRLKYAYYVAAAFESQKVSWSGEWHKHYLE